MNKNEQELISASLRDFKTHLQEINKHKYPFQNQKI